MVLDYKEIGCNIKVHRCRRGMKQAQLAELANVTEQHISHIECGSTKLSLTVMVSIADALSVEVNELLGFHTDGALQESSDLVDTALEHEMIDLLRGATDTEKRQCIELCRTMLHFSDRRTNRER